MYKVMYHIYDQLRLSGEQKQEHDISFLHDFNAVLELPQLQTLSKKLS